MASFAGIQSFLQLYKSEIQAVAKIVVIPRSTTSKIVSGQISGHLVGSVVIKA